MAIFRAEAEAGGIERDFETLVTGICGVAMISSSQV
jgi:hypothetical protein